MGTDFTNIGYDIYSSEELDDLAKRNTNCLIKRKYKTEPYMILNGGNTEVWGYGNNFDSAIPFHCSEQLITPELENWDDNEACAAPCYMRICGNNSFPIYSMDVEIVNLFEFKSKDTIALQICAHVQEMNIYKTKEDFSLKHPKVAPESYLASPSSTNDYCPKALINGYIHKIERLTNPLTLCPYYHLQVSTPFGIDFDCYAETGIINNTVWDLKEDPLVGDIFSGEVYFVAKAFKN